MTDISSAQAPPHPRSLGWLGTAALAMGGSNQSMFLITALFAGQGAILGQGSAAVPLLIVGVLLGWAAAPAWTELVLMWPNRVGGIAASCAEAFRPYSPVLANLTGVCYWWGWVPTCGVTALFSAYALHEWYLPGVPVNVLATLLVLLFMLLNLTGIKWVARVVIPIGVASSALAILSGLIPVLTGHVDWSQATTYHLTVPFPGWFGKVTSLMAGLYLIGFAAPAFEAATCHVGETVNPARNVPLAMGVSAAMAGVYFILLPVVWLGVLGPAALGKDLIGILGPTFAPLLGSLARGAGVWFIILTMFHGTVQPLAGAARTLSQLAEDGLLPITLTRRNRYDAPWVAICLTAAFAIMFLWIGDPVWLIAAANFTYLIGICLPNVAAWLLRRDAPERERPYRAPRWTIGLGLAASVVWGLSAILGFQQFGLPTVLIGLAMAYSGAFLYAWRVWSDSRTLGVPLSRRSLHIKLTGAMLLVLVLDAIGYLMAVRSVDAARPELISFLEDVFVAVAMLTVTVGLVLPGMIAHSAAEVSKAANRLCSGTVADFSRAMEALGRGDLEAAHARIDVLPVVVNSHDELGEMADSFNTLQVELARAARGLDGAREGLSEARLKLTDANEHLEQRVLERTAEVDAHARQLQQEVSERKRARTEVLEQEARLRVILNSAADGIITIDQHGIIKSFNLAAETIYGVSSDSVIGQSCLRLIPDGSVDYFRHAADESATNLLLGREVDGCRANGTRIPLAIRLSHVRYREGYLVIALVQDITERLLARDRLAELNKQLIHTARRAGMAEVANSVLHNVGNVLNSINVSAALVMEKLQASRLVELPRAAALMNEHRDDLGDFLSRDAKGRQLPLYFQKLSVYWQNERQELFDELAGLTANLQHVKDIVSRQQSLSGTSGVTEPVTLAELIEDSLTIATTRCRDHQIEVRRELAAIPTMLLDRVRVVQILINLVSNAVDAMVESVRPDRTLLMRTSWQGDGVMIIEVADTGTGILPENLSRIFSYGFTTKRGGHGFGLHASALSAQEMGGSLKAWSDGPERGSCFTLQLPCHLVQKSEELSA